MADAPAPPAHAPHPPTRHPVADPARPVSPALDSVLPRRGDPGAAAALLADPRLAARGHATLRTAATLQLQRTLGNRAAMRLVQRRASQAVPPPAARRQAVPVQRKIFIAGKPYTNPEERDGSITTMRDDAKTRRFASPAEMKKYAAGATDHLGYMTEGGIWVRLDEAALGGSFAVFGEEHGNPQDTLALVRAVNTTRFRLEAFTNYPSGKTGGKNTPQARAAVEKAKVVKLGTQTHAAEHIIPKLARALPDLEAQQFTQAIAARRAAPQPGAVVGLDADLPADAANASGEGYSLDRALMDVLSEALILLKSYEDNFFSHRLKAFYLTHKADIDQTIAQLAADTRLADTKLIDAYITGRMAPAALSDLFIAETEAMFLGSAKKKAAFAAFKGQLNLANEPNVTYTAKAKEQDYLRDYSMYEQIKVAKAAGDLLFGLGDAHRHKLAPLLKKDNIPVFELIPFLKDQKRQDEQAAMGLSDDQSTLFTQLRVGEGANKAFLGRAPTQVGDEFRLLQPPETVWRLTGARQVRSTASNITVQASAPHVTVELVWQRGGKSLTLVTRTFKLRLVPGGVAPAPAPEPAVEEDADMDVGEGRARS